MRDTLPRARGASRGFRAFPRVAASVGFHGFIYILFFIRQRRHADSDGYGDEDDKQNASDIRRCLLGDLFSGEYRFLFKMMILILPPGFYIASIPGRCMQLLATQRVMSAPVVPPRAARRSQNFCGHALDDDYRDRAAESRSMLHSRHDSFPPYDLRFY